METRSIDARSPFRGLVAALGIAALLAGCAAAPAGTPEAAKDRQQAQQLAERVRMTLESFDMGPNDEGFRNAVGKARGILVFPSAVRAAFIVGGEGGSGVLLTRDAQGGWNGPGFYTLGGASFGFQAGAKVSEVVALVMTQRGIDQLMRSTVGLGGDVSVAVGPVGGGLGAGTAGISADILTYARSSGLFGGIALDGAVIKTRHDWDQAFYGREVTPEQIARGEVRSPEAEPLYAAVTRLAGRGVAGN
jgi:lipid-binding SYLF domain-containing protein